MYVCVLYSERTQAELATQMKALTLDKQLLKVKAKSIAAVTCGCAKTHCRLNKCKCRTAENGCTPGRGGCGCDPTKCENPFTSSSKDEDDEDEEESDDDL